MYGKILDLRYYRHEYSFYHPIKDWYALGWSWHHGTECIIMHRHILTPFRMPSLKSDCTKQPYNMAKVPLCTTYHYVPTDSKVQDLFSRLLFLLEPQDLGCVHFTSGWSSLMHQVCDLQSIQKKASAQHFVLHFSRANKA